MRHWTKQAAATRPATNRTSRLLIHAAWMWCIHDVIHDELMVRTTSYIYDIKRRIPYLTGGPQTPAHALYTWPKIDSVTTSLQLWPPAWAENTKSHAHRGTTVMKHWHAQSAPLTWTYVSNSRPSFLIIFCCLFYFFKFYLHPISQVSEMIWINTLKKWQEKRVKV